VPPWSVHGKQGGRGERGRKEVLSRLGLLGRAMKREREKADARVGRERERARVWLGQARGRRRETTRFEVLFFFFKNVK
jgi:hypothetical protein